MSQCTRSSHLSTRLCANLEYYGSPKRVYRTTITHTTSTHSAASSTHWRTERLHRAATHSSYARTLIQPTSILRNRTSATTRDATTSIRNYRLSHQRVGRLLLPLIRCIRFRQRSRAQRSRPRRNSPDAGRSHGPQYGRKENMASRRPLKQTTNHYHDVTTRYAFSRSCIYTFISRTFSLATLSGVVCAFNIVWEQFLSWKGEHGCTRKKISLCAYL